MTSIKMQSRAFDGQVILSTVDSYYPPITVESVRMSPDEARLFGLELIREADRAEHAEMWYEDKSEHI